MFVTGRSLFYLYNDVQVVMESELSISHVITGVKEISGTLIQIYGAVNNLIIRALYKCIYLYFIASYFTC